MTEIIFRTLTPADVEKIYELETRSFKAAWSLNDFKECMASQKHLKVAAEVDKKILAYAVIEFSNDRNFYLMKFAVAPEFRRRGLGKIFLEFLLKLLLKWGGGGIFARQHKKCCGNSSVRNLRLQSHWANRKFLPK